MTNTNSELENKYGNLSNANLFDLVVNKHDDDALYCKRCGECLDVKNHDSSKK